jgi:hypothetical protein
MLPITTNGFFVSCVDVLRFETNALPLFGRFALAWPLRVACFFAESTCASDVGEPPLQCGDVDYQAYCRLLGR